MSEYTIGDLAKKLNITTRTIRYYDQKGLVKPSRVSESGYRLYSDEQVKQLKLIIFLKELGFSLKDIQKILEDKNGDKLIDLLLEDQLKRNKAETQKLERWERGEAGLDIEKVFKLLEVIHVQKIDFFNNNISNYLKNITLEVSKAYESNDINYLKTQSKKLLSEVENDSFDKRTFLKAAIYCNAYYDLTGVDIFTDNYKKRLSMYFSKILSGDEVWYYDDVYFFGNTQNLISPRTIYSLSFSLVFYFKNNNDLEMKF